MKLQVFLFSILFVFSSQTMDVSKITKNQIIDTLTNVNYELKQRFPNNYDPNPLGLYITILRSRPISDIEKKKILESMYPVVNIRF